MWSWYWCRPWTWQNDSFLHNGSILLTSFFSFLTSQRRIQISPHCFSGKSHMLLNASRYSFPSTRASLPPLTPGLATLGTRGGRRPSTSSLRTQELGWIVLCKIQITRGHTSQIYVHLLLSSSSRSAWTSLCGSITSIDMSLK